MNVRDNHLVKDLLDDPAGFGDDFFAPKKNQPGNRIEPPIGTVHANPNQPRKRFPSDEVLDEKAARIRMRVDRGLPPFVQLPTVIPHPDLPGEWQIHVGGIRLETGRRAKLVTFPCTVAEPGLNDPGAKLLENIDRAEMDPMDIAEGLRDLIRDEGMTKGEAGMAVGLKAAEVSRYLALLDMPDCLMAMYETGRCRSVRVLYDLVHAHEKHPAQVEAWSETAESVTRAEVLRLCGAWLREESGAMKEVIGNGPVAGEVAAATGELSEAGGSSSTAAGDGAVKGTGQSGEAGEAPENGTSSKGVEDGAGSNEPDGESKQARGTSEADRKTSGGEAERDGHTDGTGAGQRDERSGAGTSPGEGAGVGTTPRRESEAGSGASGPGIALRGRVQAKGRDGSITQVDLGTIVGVRGVIEVEDGEGGVHEVDLSVLVLASGE